jgi:VIT1/CCC1 family predicted Fe2+/Mn2+ transporter
VGEDSAERADRELLELLNELRVALPGVQVLFAFLLTVPFQQAFHEVSAFQRNVYQAALLASALSIVLLIAPAAQHRLLFGKRDLGRLLGRFNRYAIAGLICLGAALTGAILLVTSFLFGTLRAVVTTVVAVVLILAFWVVIPLNGRSARRSAR